MTVFKDPRALVQDTVSTALVYLAGGTPTPTTSDNNGMINVPAIHTPTTIVDKDNIRPVLIDTGFYQPGELTGITAPPSVSRSVGVIFQSQDYPLLVKEGNQFYGALTATGHSVTVYYSRDNPAVEKSNVETLISQGIQVLIICPVDGSAASAAVEEARAAGVKVISYDRLVLNTAAVDFYLTFDNIGVGEEMGDYLISQATGTGNNLYLYAGSPGDNNSFQFFEGTWNKLQPKLADGTFVVRNSSEAVTLKNKPTLTHAEQVSIFNQIAINDWDPNNATILAQANLAAGIAADKGNVSILAPNDDTARAIADVFAADPQVTSYKVTGQDAVLASVQYIIDGKQSMTIFKDLRALVQEAVSTAIVYLAGGTPTPTTTDNNGVINVPARHTATIPVDKNNIRPVLIDTGFYQDSDLVWPYILIYLPLIKRG